MQQDFNNINVLFPSGFDWEEIKRMRAIQPFDDGAINFLNALSQELNRDSRTRAFPDVATFAFFCRKANLLNLKKNYSNESELRLGRGIVFHIAPSNVPVNFAYSLICGILSGNINIVRVSSKEFEQVRIIRDAIMKIAENQLFSAICKRIVLVQYDRLSSATTFFSSFCDVRIIWGGNETIANIRNSAIPARTFDVTFADRYSICAINADEYIKEKQPDTVAAGFYNDTYLFDQNACTSPHLVVWTGENDNIEQSKKIFWDALYHLVKSKYTPIQPIIAVDKLTTLFSQSIQQEKVKKEQSTDNILWRVQLEELYPDVDKFRCSSGYFSEININCLEELSNIVNKTYQTLAYYGFSKSELQTFVKETHWVGIDRIVPIGHTMDFSLTWDGYDLINVLSRSCEIL